MAIQALDRRSPLPLYAQVTRRLKAMISAREHPPDRFHSEGELCAMFGISRATVRQAMRVLADEGWVHRQQGQGTFVNREKFDESFSPQMNFLEQWARQGRPLVLELRRFDIGPCPRDVCEWLGIGPNTPVLRIERVRRDGPVVASCDHRYIHPDLSASIQREEARTESLLVLLGRRVRLVRGENKVESALAGADGAAALGVRRSDPVLIREMVYFSDDGVPVMAGRSLYPADRVRCAFSVELSAASGEHDLSRAATSHPGGITDLPDIHHWPRTERIRHSSRTSSPELPSEVS
jgi:GntR family transcriptional regulator